MPSSSLSTTFAFTLSCIPLAFTPFSQADELLAAHDANTQSTTVDYQAPDPSTDNINSDDVHDDVAHADEHEHTEQVEKIVVQATRSGRIADDQPIRVELIDREEIEEKAAMRPGNISMLVAETGGVRVQTTSPALGSANIRLQGLYGRILSCWPTVCLYMVTKHHQLAYYKFLRLILAALKLLKAPHLHFMAAQH